MRLRTSAWVGGLALAATATALETLPAPFVWIGLGVGAMLLATTWRARSERARLVALYAAVAALVLTGAEAWHAARDHERLAGYDPSAYFRGDADLGYALNADQSVPARKAVAGVEVYDVVYTIGPHGLRVEPPVAADAGDGCVLFFGGSFTFGEGLQDEEALPYRTGVRMKGRMRVVNFGIHGYGPHHMLAVLESGFVDEVLEGCRPRDVVYQGTWFHAFRSAGVETWDKHGPRYVPDGEGGVVRRSQFADDPRLLVRSLLMERLRRSYLFEAVRHARRQVGSEEQALYVAVVDRARRVAESRWPGVRFHVLFWDAREHPVDEALEARGLSAHRVSAILPGQRETPERWTLHPRDRHPNARALDRLAAYVVEEILAPDAGAGEDASSRARRSLRTRPRPAR